MLQPVAGKISAVITEIPFAFFADAQPAIGAGFGPVLLRKIAAPAGIFLAQMRLAYRAIHPAGSNQFFFHILRNV